MTRLFVTGTFRDKTFRDKTFRDKTFRDKMGTLYTWIHVIILNSTWPYQVHENGPQIP